MGSWVLEVSKVLQNFEKLILNMPKNEEKSCSTCIKPIFWLILATQKSNLVTRSIISH